jgi:hypothetical protein
MTWHETNRQTKEAKRFLQENGDYVAIKRDRAERLIAASTKLREFSRSIVGYGGSVPASEALTDDDIAPLPERTP